MLHCTTNHKTTGVFMPGSHLLEFSFNRSIEISLTPNHDVECALSMNTIDSSIKCSALIKKVVYYYVLNANKLFL